MPNHAGTQTLHTPRLTLRRFMMDDARAMYDNWATDAQSVKYMSWEPHASVDESRGILSEWIAAYEKPDYYHWAIVLDGTPIGSVGLQNMVDRSSRGEIGYCLGSRWWNRGYMSEAVKAVFDYLFAVVGMHRISAVHDVKNVGSGRVMQKNGMTKEGMLRAASLRRDGGYGDMIVYGILREEWKLRGEIAEYCALPCAFTGFAENPRYDGAEISLRWEVMHPANPVKRYVPDYAFSIRKGGEKIGEINLRVGYNEGLYYGGNIGYAIDEKQRGHGYAVDACRLLLPLMRAHGMRAVTITNDVNNAASRRVCEKLGAKCLRLAKVPAWTELYAQGQRELRVFLWEFGE